MRQTEQRSAQGSILSPADQHAAETITVTAAETETIRTNFLSQDSAPGARSSPHEPARLIATLDSAATPLLELVQIMTRSTQHKHLRDMLSQLLDLFS